MRTLVSSLTLVLLAAAPAAQFPRPPQRVDPGSLQSFDPVVTSAGDLTLAAWATASSVFVARSNGTAKSWSSPVRVDADTSGASKDIQDGDLAIAGGSAYLLWKDERFGASNDEIYFSRSSDGGATWRAEQRIDKSVPAGIGAVRDWRLAVAPGTPDQVYVLLSVDPTLFANEVLILVRSFDGGASFQPAVVVPQGVVAGAHDVDNGDLVATGSTLFVTWVDNRNGEDDVFLQKSTDRGNTWLLSDLRLDSSVGANAESVPELEVHGNIVAVLWQEERPNNAPDSLWANVSLDGAATFGGDRRVGSYTFNVVDVDNHRVGITGTGNILAAWDDNRLGIDETFVAMSSDGGLSWRPDVQLSSNGGEFPRVLTGPGADAVVLWTGGVFPEHARAALSRDGGATWLPPISVSANAGDADAAEGAFNELYGNFVVAYLADDRGLNNAFVGGFRPQTAAAVGWGTTAPQLRFDLTGFGTDSLALVGLSFGSGPLAIPGDPRVLCLTGDPLLVSTLSSPVFQATLSNGAGATPAIPNLFTGPPVGLTVHYGAIGVTPGGRIGRITDARSFQL